MLHPLSGGPVWRETVTHVLAPFVTHVRALHTCVQATLSHPEGPSLRAGSRLSRLHWWGAPHRSLWMRSGISPDRAGRCTQKASARNPTLACACEIKRVFIGEMLSKWWVDWEVGAVLIAAAPWLPPDLQALGTSLASKLPRRARSPGRFVSAIPRSCTIAPSGADSRRIRMRTKLHLRTKLLGLGIGVLVAGSLAAPPAYAGSPGPREWQKAIIFLHLTHHGHDLRVVWRTARGFMLEVKGAPRRPAGACGAPRQ